MKKIKSYEELLEYSEKCMLEAKDPKKLKIDKALNYKITITGDSWDGTIDYRVAQYIVDTQKAVDKIFKEVGIELAKDDRPVVKFKVQEGSLEIIVEIAKSLNKLFENMTGRQKTYIATLLILGATGGFSYHDYNQYKQKQVTLEHELSMQQDASRKEITQQQEMVKIINSLSDKIPSYGKQNKQLAQHMQQDDEINNSIKNSTLTKVEFKKEYPVKNKLKAKNVYLDDKYSVTGIKLDPSKISIESGGHTYDCISSLNIDELDEVIEKLKAALAAGVDFELDLKISAKYFPGSKSLKDIIVYEIGKPRKGAKSFEELLK